MQNICITAKPITFKRKKCAFLQDKKLSFYPEPQLCISNNEMLVTEPLRSYHRIRISCSSPGVLCNNVDNILITSDKSKYKSKSHMGKKYHCSHADARHYFCSLAALKSLTSSSTSFATLSQLLQQI